MITYFDQWSFEPDIHPAQCGIIPEANEAIASGPRGQGAIERDPAGTFSCEFSHIKYHFASEPSQMYDLPLTRPPSRTQPNTHMKIFVCVIVNTLAQSQQHDIVLPTIFQIAQQSIRALLHRHNEREKGLAIGCTEHRCITECRMIHEMCAQQCQ